MLTRRLTILFVAMLGLAACATTTQPTIGPDGKPLPRVYRISSGSEAEIQYRMLDAVNALRAQTGGAPLQLNAELNAAAETHSRDMARQNRPWHFGSDGSSPIDRVRRAGYNGTLVGETLSETYETELETLAAWMEEEGPRRVILDQRATDMGFAWLQEQNGKIWWTLTIGAAGSGFGPVASADTDDFTGRISSVLQ